MNFTKPNKKFELSKAGIVQCGQCGKLQPKRILCTACDHELDYDFYTQKDIPTAKIKEVPFSIHKEHYIPEIRLNQ